VTNERAPCPGHAATQAALSSMCATLLQGRQLRYVHLPGALDPAKRLEQYVGGPRSTRGGGGQRQADGVPCPPPPHPHPTHSRVRPALFLWLQRQQQVQQRVEAAKEMLTKQHTRLAKGAGPSAAAEQGQGGGQQEQPS